MARQIFLVEGQTGEYSDRTDWPVAAYESESEAAKHVAALDVWLRANGLHFDDDRYVNCDKRRIKCSLDHNFSCDYTGTRYYIYGVELRDAAPSGADDVAL